MSFMKIMRSMPPWMFALILFSAVVEMGVIGDL